MATDLRFVDASSRIVIQAPKAKTRIRRNELIGHEWTAIRPMPPNKPRGVPRVNDRRVLNGIFWGGHDELATRSVGMIARSVRLVCFADLTSYAAETPCFDQSPIL